MDNRTLYERNIQDRSTLCYVLGLIIRWKQNIKYVRARRIARKRGATIGEGVIMPLSLAKRANSNLTIGNHVSIQTDKIDLRSPVSIGNQVIIGGVRRLSQLLITSIPPIGNTNVMVFRLKIMHGFLQMYLFCLHAGK